MSSAADHYAALGVAPLASAGDAVSRAVALLLSGKAALIGGVALAAGYAAVAAHQLPDLDAELPRERVLVAVAVSLLSVGLALAGAALERACRIPGPPDDESGDAPASGPGEPGPSD